MHYHYKPKNSDIPKLFSYLGIIYICFSIFFNLFLIILLSFTLLGLLDKVSLYNCMCVSKHWQWLTDEILTEVEVKKNVEKQAMILQVIHHVKNHIYILAMANAWI